MLEEIKRKLKEKYRKGQTAKTEEEPDCSKDSFKDELSKLEKLMAEEVKLKEMAEDKRREISKAIEELEAKMSLFKEELEKMRFQFEGLFKDKEIEKEQIESKLLTGKTESNDVGEGGENEISRQQEDWELRLQSKEEENNLLKNRIAELEEQLRIQKEKKDREIVGGIHSSEEVPEGQQ